MSMSYKIKFQNTADSGVVVELDKIRELALPAHLAVSVGPAVTKIARLADYYNKAFTGTDKKHDSFRFIVASIHKHASDKGTLTVLSGSKAKEIHTKGFVKFLSDYQESIAMIAPYILQASSVAQTEGMEVQEHGAEAFIPNVSTGDETLDAIHLKGNGLERLSADDMRQIKQLMLDGQQEAAIVNEEVEHTSEAQDVEVASSPSVAEQIIAAADTPEEEKNNE